MPFINVISNVIDTTFTAKYGMHQHRQRSCYMIFEYFLDVMLYKNSQLFLITKFIIQIVANSIYDRHKGQAKSHSPRAIIPLF